MPVILMGMNSLLLQVVCLRQILSTFSGNELIIGITLAAWLLLVSLGSYIGSKIDLENAFGISFVDVAVLAQPTVIFIEIIRHLVNYSLGEVLPLPLTIAWIILSLSLLCVTLGLQFPLAVKYLHEKTSEVYSFEAAGAFAGGLIFAFMLAGNFNSYQLAFTASTSSILVAVYMLRKAVLMPLVILPLLIYFGGQEVLDSFKYKGFEFVSRSESRYGEVEVFKMGDQYNLYSSDKLLFSYPDVQTEELTAHIPMSMQDSADDILLVGGSPAVVRELLKYPVKSVDFVEIDPVLIDVAKGLLTDEDRSLLEDRRVRVIHTDARRFIKGSEPDRYDLIILNIPEPATANLNRFYTVEFFREAEAILKNDGILHLSLPASFGYISKKMQMANGSVFNSVKEVFSHVEVSSEEYGIIAASRSPLKIDAGSLISRFMKKGVDTEHFEDYILTDAFKPLQVEMVKERLGKVDELNTDRRPISYLYNLMLWSDMHRGKWLNLLLGLTGKGMMIISVLFLVLLSAVFHVKREPVYNAVFTTGYFTMALFLIVILTYQSHFGYVYERMGLMSGTFMLGGAVGAYLLRASARPEKWLRVFDILALALILVTYVLMSDEAVFYVIVLAAGFVGGGQFAAASRTIRKEKGVYIAGRLYAVDLCGACIGSLFTAIFMVPLVGIQKTLLFLAVMKALSLTYLLVYKKV